MKKKNEAKFRNMGKKLNARVANMKEDFDAVVRLNEDLRCDNERLRRENNSLSAKVCMKILWS